jgi:hypothetical protein
LLLSYTVGCWDLLVIPPQTDPAIAAWLMTAATGPLRSHTASDLLERAEFQRIVAEADRATRSGLGLRGWPWRPCDRAGTLSVVILETAPVKPPGPSFQAQHVRVRNPQSRVHLQVVSDVIP